MSMTTKILIVEDDADSAGFLRILLEREGYLVQAAATAKRALEELPSWKPEIILMDLMLPDVEGMDLLTAQLHKAAEKLALTAENRRLRAELDESASSDGLIGRSKPMRQLRQLIKSVAPTDANVLITGENGSGKEVVATVIHQSSKRAAGPFIKVNRAAIPNDLIESELFGHKRGAFTGAVNDKQGLMDMANNGSLLLDEIGELSTNLQV